MSSPKNRRKAGPNGQPSPSPKEGHQSFDLGEWSLVSYVLTTPAFAVGQPPRQEIRSIIMDGWVTTPDRLQQIASQVLAQEQQFYVSRFPNATVEALNIARGMSVTVTGWTSPDPRHISLMAARKLAAEGRLPTGRKAGPAPAPRPDEPDDEPEAASAKPVAH